MTAYHVRIWFVTPYIYTSYAHMLSESTYSCTICHMCVCFLTLYPLYMKDSLSALHDRTSSLSTSYTRLQIACHTILTSFRAHSSEALYRDVAARHSGYLCVWETVSGFIISVPAFQRKMSFSFCSSFSTLHPSSPFFFPLFLLFGLAGSHAIRCYSWSIAIRWYWWWIPWESWYAWY